jgi:glycosyltransferase 2 family protein
MGSTKKKWLSAGLRTGVCVIALVWVAGNVTYHDYVTLTDGSRARLDSSSADGTVEVVTESGVRRSVRADEIARDEHGDKRVEVGLRSTFLRADKRLLWLCLAMFAPVTLFQSLRFQLLLRAQDISLTYWESAKLCYAGNFLNYITALGTTGGDVLKMYYVSLHTEHKTEAVTTVALDRVVGLLGLVLLVACVTMFRLADEKLVALRYAVVAILLAVAIAGVVLYSRRVRGWLRLDAMLARLPFATHIVRAESAARRLGHHKSVVLAALACTFALQAIAITSFVIAGVAVGMRSDPAAVWDYYAYLPSGLAVAAVPISFQGLGTMEAFYKHVLLGSHGSLPALLCLAMAIRLIGLLWSLPGALVLMTGSYRPRVASEKVQPA